MSAQADVKVVGDNTAAVSLSNILVTNSATVATDIVLSANGVNSEGIAEYVDRSDGIVVGYPRMTFQVRRPTQVSRVYKVSAKVFIPRLATTSPSTNTGIEPAPTKVYEMQAHLDFLLPERSTAVERYKLFSMVKSLFLQTINASDADPTVSTGSPLESAITNLEPVY